MADEIRHIQFPQYAKYADKKTAIAALETYLNNTPDDFLNGEEVILEYEEGDVVCSAPAIINKKNGSIKLFVSMNEFETVKIIESAEEPEDKDSLWLSDSDDEGNTDLRSQVAYLNRRIKEMSDVIAMLRNSLENTLGGGDLLDSEKYDLENRSQQEQPKESTFYDSGDTIATEVKICIADVDLDEYAKDDTPYKLYRDSSYPLQIKFLNEKGYEVKETPEMAPNFIVTVHPENAAIAEINEYVEVEWGGHDGGYPYVPPQRILTITEAKSAGDITIFVSSVSESGEQLSKVYNIPFYYEQEPIPEKIYPNHMLVKHTKEYKTIEDRSNYLNVYEFVWCIEKNTLYLKAEASNGSVQLFKINGQGSDPVPTGETTGITYVVNGSNIEATDKSSAITIDENGYMVIPNARVENGLLILNDTGGGGGEETEITIDGDFLKFVNAEVDTSGYLRITSSKVKVENEIMII